MIHRDLLLHYLDELLAIDEIADFCPNGLQVEGKDQVSKIITGVSVSVQLFQESVARRADLVMVHHGLLWDREPRQITGSLKKRVQILLQHDMSLLAYHLPLDKHPDLGNNGVAANALNLQGKKPFGSIGYAGVTEPCSLDELLRRVEGLYRQSPLVFSFGPDQIRSVGICSGGCAQDVVLAISQNLDAFITGEAKESTLHLAKEGGIHFIAAGHYATERLGIQALGEHVAAKFSLPVEFVEIPNPV